MTLSLHTIKPKKGSLKKRKRIGRGNASGTGTYSGKGLKGQKCRSGVSNLKRLGMKQMLLQIPKKRGFKSHKPNNIALNLFDLNKYFKDGEKVNPKTLLEKGLVDTAKQPIKILGNGDLKVSKLEIADIKVSKKAKEQIEKNGGKIIENKK
jgi:large subunit ribosomal protein L15